MMKILFSLVFAVGLVFGNSMAFVPEKHPNWKLLPHETCGEVSSSRIIGGVEADMNAYPWIARIGYSKTNNKVSFLCGGVIVNSKTIVTAAHCLQDMAKSLNVSVVRLGEHNTETNPDCDGSFCADPVVDIETADLVIAKNYDTPKLAHDIALIRLKKDITFTDFVKPICIPGEKLFTRDLVGMVGEVAGWGIYDIGNPKGSKILQTVKLPILANKVCTKFLPKDIKIQDNQLCVGGEVGEDSCGGDSGGPLMKVDDGKSGPRYYLFGVVSFGSKRCGKSKTPGIYTKMTSYTKWFLDNLLETKSDAKNV